MHFFLSILFRKRSPNLAKLLRLDALLAQHHQPLVVHLLLPLQLLELGAVRPLKAAELVDGEYPAAEGGGGHTARHHVLRPERLHRADLAQRLVDVVGHVLLVVVHQVVVEVLADEELLARLPARRLPEHQAQGVHDREDTLGRRPERTWHAFRLFFLEQRIRIYQAQKLVLVVALRRPFRLGSVGFWLLKNSFFIFLYVN